MCGGFERFDATTKTTLAVAHGEFGDEILWVLDEGDSHGMPPQIVRLEK
jgi:hypothetical protein